MRQTVTFLFSCSLGLMLAACSAAARYSDRATLRIGWIGEPDTLNPFLAVESRSYECFRLMYSFLTGFGKHLEPAPGLAERWDVSADGRTWTYHLVRDVRWHDGEPLTASDVKFTYEFILRNKFDLFLPYLAQVKRVETPDPHTVILSLDRPSVMMQQIFVPVLPRHVWEKVDPKTAVSQFLPMGSGPFRFVEWRKSRYIKFSANERYFRGRPHIDDVVFVDFANTNTMMQALRLGEIQAVTNIPPPLFRLLAREPGIKTIVRPGNGFTQITINVWNNPKSRGHPALRDARVRQAMAHAIDRQRLIAVSRLGYGDPGSTIIPKMFPYWHWEPPAGERMDYDPHWSRQILQRSGYRVGRDGIRRDKKGRPLRFRLYARAANSEELVAAQLIGEQLREVGIGVDLRSMEPATQDNLIKDRGDFDLALYAWGGDADPTFLLSLFTTRQIKNWNDYYYSNPEYDRLFEQQLTLVDRTRRRQVLQYMQRIVYHDLPTIVLFYDTNLQGYRTDRFAGWADDQAEGVLMTLGGSTYLSVYPLGART